MNTCFLYCLSVLLALLLAATISSNWSPSRMAAAAAKSHKGKETKGGSTTSLDDADTDDDLHGPKSGTERMELIQLVVLNRHGHRSPNTPYWKLCPNDRYNRKAYDVAGGQLTALGFRQELEFGQWVHKTYGDFVGSRYDPRQHYMRAVSEPRTMQSALIASQGVFPNGFGPSGITPARTQYVPIFDQLDQSEILLEDVPCYKETGADVKEWMNTSGAEILSDPVNKQALNDLVSLCGSPSGTSGTDDMVIKVMIDGVIFNHDYGLNVLNGNISPQTFFTLRSLANTLLQGKLYSKDTQKTYSVAQFPHDLLHHFKLATENERQRRSSLSVGGVPKWNKYAKYSHFTGHREELYGMSYFFNFGFQVPNYPYLELPAGSSYVFGLYNGTAPTDTKDTFYVKMDLWTPDNGVFTLEVKDGCTNSHLCTLDELQQIYQTRVARTGTWDQICQHELTEEEKNG